MQEPLVRAAADALTPPVGTPPGPFWRCAGALLAGRTSHGDTTVTLERVSFWMVLLTACFTWWGGKDIPSTMASFLNVLVGAVFGQSALSTVGYVVRRSGEVRAVSDVGGAYPSPSETTSSSAAPT